MFANINFSPDREIDFPKNTMTWTWTFWHCLPQTVKHISY